MKIFTKLPPATFESNGLVFRPFNDTDADFLLSLAINEPVKRFVPWAKRIHDIESAKTMIQDFNQSYVSKIRVRYVIGIDGNTIAYAGLWPDSEDDFYEYGFAVSPHNRGHGYGGLIVDGLINMTKTTLRAKGLIAHIHDENTSSKKCVIRAGFNPTNVFSDVERRYELVF